MLLCLWGDQANLESFSLCHYPPFCLVLCVPSKLLEKHVFCFLLLGRGTAKINYTKFLRIISSEALAYFKSYLQMNIRIDFASIRLRYEKKRCFWGEVIPGLFKSHHIYDHVFCSPWWLVLFQVNGRTQKEMWGKLLALFASLRSLELFPQNYS